MADKIYTIPTAAKTATADNVRAAAVDLRDHGIPITAKAVAGRLGCKAADAERILDAMVGEAKMAVVAAQK